MMCNNITSIAAVNGTPCGRNSVCSNGQCVSQAAPRMSSNKKANESMAAVDDCLFGDEIIKNQRIIDRQMRYIISQLSCEEYMNLDESRSPVEYCSNEIFRKTCCQTCKSLYIISILFVDYLKDSFKSSLFLVVDLLAVSKKLDCTAKLCKNGAACFNDHQNMTKLGFKCKCLPGYFGKFCELSKSNEIYQMLYI